MLLLVRVSLITGLWILSLCLMIVGTAVNEWPGMGPLVEWALWVGLLALVATGWHLLILERHRSVAIAEAAAAAALRHYDGDHVRSLD